MKPRKKVERPDPVRPQAVVYTCAGCEGRDGVIKVQAAHIKSLERQLEIVANLADPMVQARVATAKGELEAPVVMTAEQIQAAFKARSPQNPRRWREDLPGPKGQGRSDTPSPDLDPEGEFETALAKANEAETEGLQPS